MHKSNYRKKQSTLKKIMGARIFAQGWRDGYLGNGFRPEYDHMKIRDQDRYERGRLFAAACPWIQKLKEGNRLLNSAMQAFCVAIMKGDFK